MKQCPACRSQYTDDTLQYCLQDGTPLESIVRERGGETGQAEIPEEETIVSERWVSRPPEAPIEPDRDMRSTHDEPKRKSRTGLIVFATAIGTLLVLGVLGAGFLILSRGRPDTPRSSTNVNIAIAKSPEPSPSPPPTARPSPASNSSNVNTEPTPNAAEIGREVTKAIAGWQDATESLDTDTLYDRYADTVDYYRNPGATREFVIRDKERAFSTYDSIRFRISNIQITPGKTADTAVAEFDKAWVFDGDSHSEGKVRSHLSLKKVDGRWLINGERDVKVY